MVVLGGTGDMGSLAVRELGKELEVEQITIVGRNKERAEALAKEVGSRAQTRILDVQDTTALKAALAGHDVAVGALGPFYLYERPIAQAAIDVGIPYVSICDDYDATQSVLELDASAKERGVTILTGMGWTPGITNICAKKGAQLLDTAEKIHISWAGASADAEGLAVILHTMHIFTGKIPTFVDGTWRLIRAGSGRRSVRFPDPMGAVAVYHVGHPEPVTIPRFLPGVQEVTLRGGLAETFLTYLGIGVARLGLTRTPERRARLAAQMKPLLPALGALGSEAHPLSGAHVEVRGMKDGRPAKIELATVDRMVKLTSLPLVIGALMLGRGDIQSPGVIAPESPGGPDPDAVFRALAQYGVEVHVGEVEYLDADE